MKKTVLLSLLAGVSFSAISAPYAGLEYGLGTTNHQSHSQFQSYPNIKLDPSNDEGIFTGFLGYTITPQWAIELGYSQFDLDDDHSQYIGYNSATNMKTEEEWNAHIKGKQFILSPVYTYAISNKWSAKFKAGITYTQYNISSSHYLENENEISDVETIIPKKSYSRSSNELGGIFTVGSEYEIYPQFAVSINAKYQFDSFAQTASFNVGSTYYF